MPTRLFRFAALLAVSWCVMTFAHEAGHLVGGWCCGGTLIDADLWPWHLPYSLFEPDPHPLVTLWCGPILGVLVPLAAALIARRDGLWFVAHFCMLANGAYLATAWVAGDRLLDTARLLHHGAHPATIAAYCVLSIGFGYVGFRRSVVRALTKPVSPGDHSQNAAPG